MLIYTIDKDGYIIEDKVVGNKYVLSEFDFKGKAPYPNNHHHETGLERPLTNQQQLDIRTQQLKDIIADKQLLGEDISKEQDELRAIKGGTHDEYLTKIEQDAIDAYTLELLEGGL